MPDVSPDALVEALESFGGQPVKAKDLGKKLGLGADDRGAVRDALRALVDEGRVLQLEGRRFTLAKDGTVLKGTVERKASGFGWFLPDDRTKADAFLPPHELTGLVDGDRVLCRIERAPKGPIATLVKVLRRTRTLVTGTLRRQGRSVYVEVDGHLLSGPVVIPTGPEGNADTVEDGSVVEALLVEYPTNVTTAVGRIVRSLGKRGEIDAEIERILADKGIIRAFPPEVEEQASQYGAEPSEADKANRIDLRALPLCTIDGETAKDFDDAVHGVRDGADIVVTVAIADVSHYVRAGTPLDVEAARRGTSIYYPGRVVPMLPEALSNGLCSLRPDVDRLCLVAEMVVTAQGVLRKTRFFEGVMRSHARLTYTLVQKFLDGEADAKGAIPPAVQESLRCLHEASIALRKNRSSRGSLDFDLPETVIALDDKGEPVKIHPLERLYAHKLIEDLMVGANEAVASKFEESEWPCVYRIHEPPDPDKLERFLKLVRQVAEVDKVPRIEPGTTPDGKQLQKVMRSLVDHPLRTALDSLMLRSMMQAKYSASNVGHFGLGSDAYLHFTSPIRRYPDLVVHRLLRERLQHKRRDENVEAREALHQVLDDIAASSSECERKATDVERSVDALFAAWFMKDRVGEICEGTVSSVAEFGLFVRLTPHHVEGLLRAQDLPRDYYAFDDVRLRLTGERTGRVFTVGDKVVIRVAGVDLSRRQVSFAWAEEAGAEEREAREERARVEHDVESVDDGRPRRGKKRGAEEKPRREAPPPFRHRARPEAAPEREEPRRRPEPAMRERSPATWPRGPDELRRQTDGRRNSGARGEGKEAPRGKPAPAERSEPSYLEEPTSTPAQASTPAKPGDLAARRAAAEKAFEARRRAHEAALRAFGRRLPVTSSSDAGEETEAPVARGVAFEPEAPAKKQKNPQRSRKAKARAESDAPAEGKKSAGKKQDAKQQDAKKQGAKKQDAKKQAGKKPDAKKQGAKKQDAKASASTSKPVAAKRAAKADAPKKAQPAGKKQSDKKSDKKETRAKADGKKQSSAKRGDKEKEKPKAKGSGKKKPK